MWGRRGPGRISGRGYFLKARICCRAGKCQGVEQGGRYPRSLALSPRGREDLWLERACFAEGAEFGGDDAGEDVEADHVSDRQDQFLDPAAEAGVDSAPGAA